MALDKDYPSSVLLKTEVASMSSFVQKPRTLSDGMSVLAWW